MNQPPPEDVTIALLRQLARRAFRHKEQWPRQIESTLASLGLSTSTEQPPSKPIIAAFGTQQQSGRHSISSVLTYVDGDSTVVSIDEILGLLYLHDPSVQMAVAMELKRIALALGLPDTIVARIDSEKECLTARDLVTRFRAADRIRDELRNDLRFAFLTLLDTLNFRPNNPPNETVAAALGVSDALYSTVTDLSLKIDAADSEYVEDQFYRVLEASQWKLSIDSSSGAQQSTPDPPLSIADYVLRGERNGISWPDLASLATVTTKDPSGLGRRLSLARELTRHFLMVIECALPSAKQHILARCSLLIASFLEFLVYVRGGDESILWPQLLRRTTYSIEVFWRFGRSPVYSSSEYARICEGDSPFISQIVRAIGRQLRSSTEFTLADEQKNLISQFLRASVFPIVCLPSDHQTEKDDELVAVAVQWFDRIGDSQSAELARGSRQFAESELSVTVLRETLRQFSEATTESAEITLRCVDSAVRHGLLSRKEIIDLWEDADWIARLTRSGNEQRLEDLLSSTVSWFDLGPSDDCIKWQHLLIDTAMSGSVKEDALDAILSAIATTAVRTNTVSAIDRLVAVNKGSPHPDILRQSLSYLRSQIGLAPPWIAGRMRAVCVSLDG